ncbi:glyoxylate/hydroxypyruvate reductase A [Mitsuaria sp. WAJ17]|uniref:2-hydroxyacid dehydrogenase n=1 Tax=Mitsuaria sp. WAJ17 TaxID=2761452 RepID=UPI001603BC43|nr:glyoxylate/hydroxypyruvate reductase A [Mitsuaria sp. WAJ17]MBB2484755.1 glyoxylate/hydroxypyruvate reductase A [Mitsuaria sp. WAJ17]
MALLLCGAWPLDRPEGRAEQQRWLQALRQALPGEDWVLHAPEGAAQAAAIEVAVVANPPPGSLQGLPRLALIQSLWAGVDRLVQDLTLPPGVPVCRMVDPAMNEAMVQTALWATLALHRGFFQCQQQQRTALWRQPPQLRAAEWQVLVLGQGELGGRVGRSLAGLGYAVAGWSRRSRQHEGVTGLHGEEGLARGLATADTVINLLPLTDETRGFFDAARLARFKQGAGFINLARGAHVDEQALLAALDAGRIGHAVLDVFQQEPLPAPHPFWSHSQVTVLPHTAAQTDPRTAAEVVAANVRALRSGAALRHRVERSQGY